jgi:lipoprotein-releasing system ATP-binding protein
MSNVANYTTRGFELDELANGGRESPGGATPNRDSTGGLTSSVRLLPAARGAALLLSARQLHKSYRKGKLEIPVLRGVDFDVCEGGFTAIVGQSGSGKSTLLHLLGTLDAPDDGEIYFEGNRIDHLPSVSRDILRNRHFGMIFQFYHLLPELTTLENVLIPSMIAEGALRYWFNKRRHVERARHLLDMVGLSHRLNHKPRELSGGEMQRAAIARALIADPQLLLADEPTGNLDRQTGREILTLLRSLNVEQNLTIVMVTHDNAIADQADNIVRLVEGRVEQV